MRGEGRGLRVEGTHPGSHAHVRLKQAPCPEHELLTRTPEMNCQQSEALRLSCSISHSPPTKPGSHTHVLLKHAPWNEQFLSHAAATGTSHPAPPHSASHTHVAFAKSLQRHVPCPLHLRVSGLGFRI